MKKEVILAIFDKANGYVEWEDSANDSVRDEFTRLLDAVYSLKAKSVLSMLSPAALKLLDEDIAKSKCVHCGKTPCPNEKCWGGEFMI